MYVLWRTNPTIIVKKISDIFYLQVISLFQEWKVVNPYNVRVRRKNPVTSKYVSRPCFALRVA